jgi:hypothetical protein
MKTVLCRCALRHASRSIALPDPRDLSRRPVLLALNAMNAAQVRSFCDPVSDGQTPASFMVQTVPPVTSKKLHQQRAVYRQRRSGLRRFAL